MARPVLLHLVVVVLIVILSLVSSSSALLDASKPLSSLVDDAFPWRHLTANSEQVQPVYLGLTPREIELFLGRN